jgi:acyl carrier protein
MLTMSWTHDEVVSEVSAMIQEHSDVAIDITEKTELVADLGIDSLGVMEVVADIEDKFEMTIADSALRDVSTLGDVVKAIERSLEESGRLKGQASS